MNTKNLEAQNEIYKSIIRTPFAVLLGGHLGLIANTIFSIFNVRHEIKREEEFKSWLNNQFIKETSFDIKQEKYHQEKNQKMEKSSNNIDYLANEFKNACNPQDVFNCYFTFNNKFSKNFANSAYFSFIPKKSIINGVYYSIKEFIGEYYPLDQFIEIYKSDLNSNNIERMYRLNDNKNHTAYIYKKINSDDGKHNWIFTI